MSKEGMAVDFIMTEPNKLWHEERQNRRPGLRARRVQNIAIFGERSAQRPTLLLKND